jgi:2-keto-3-deoxy-6-phosphogluconate aldolase
MKSLEQLHKDFGAFFPTGHMVVAFQQPQDAHQVMHELEASGRVEVLELSPQEMADFAEKNLHEAGFIANMGTSLATVQSFLDAARAGATFLILPTPDSQTAEHVSQAIHHVPFVLAERYHRLVIETVH